MKTRTIKQDLAVAALGVLGVVAPVWAVSLSAIGPAQPVPEDRVGRVALNAGENWTAGSATLVPLMAAETQANKLAAADVPATGTGTAVGKPIDDIQFVRQATENGRKEVSAARDALPQLKNPELKRIAEMLVNDHSNANAKLSQLAESKSWPVPAPQPAAAPASGTASSDFDAKWTADMIAGHERSIALFRAQASGGEDKELRKFARETLPTIEHHLAELRSLQK